MAETPNAVEKQKKPKIVLPGDRKVELFVLGQVFNAAVHRIHTADAYDKEILVQDVNSLSKETLRMDESFSRRLGAKQSKYGAIRDVPHEGIFRRPPNMLVVFVSLLAALGIVAYGQSNPTIAAQAEYVYTYFGADLAVLGLLLAGLVVWAWRVRKGGKKA